MAKPNGLKHTNIQFKIYQQYINELKHSMAMQPINSGGQVTF